MATRRSKNISLTPKLERFVARRVASGRYTSASEVVREGLRLLEEREAVRAELRTQIDKGVDQARRGKLLDGEAVFADLERSLRRPRRTRKPG